MNSKIKIAYILPADVRGGVEEHVLSLIQNIDKERFEPFLVAPEKLADSLTGDIEPQEVTILRLKIRSVIDFSGALKLYRFFRKHKIDIVNTHMFVATFYYAPVAKLAGVPVLLETTHLLEKWRLEKGFIRRNSFIIDRLLCLFLDKILAVSHACKKDLIQMKKIPSAKIVVVQNGRDLEKFKPGRGDRRKRLRQKYNIDEDVLVLGVFARLNFQKGHTYLLAALKQINCEKRRLKVIFVGDGELRDELIHQCEVLHISDTVIFAGFQSDVPGFLDMIDIKVLPSLHEGLPLCVIEALAMGKPVIATAVDGTPEIILHQQTGLLVPPKDADVLADVLLYAINHRDEMDLMGKRGREYVVRRFSLKRQVAETQKVYQDLMRSKQN